MLGIKNNLPNLLQRIASIISDFWQDQLNVWQDQNTNWNDT